MKADLTYDEYLKSFYPYQDENVFTHNNWTLSDEFIQLIQSNSFYQQHVRWNIERFRPGDRTTTEVETSSTQVPPLINCDTRPANDSQQEILQQQLISNDVEEEGTANTCATSIRTKRKADLSEHLQEHQTRTQPRRMKKN